MQKNIDLKLIDPSPFQVRKYSDEDKAKELAVSIKREGLIEPIVVRTKGNRYEIIAGHRRVEAVREYTDWKTIPAQIIKADDLQAQRISAAENIQREDLSAIEETEAIVKIVDAELIEDKKYASMGKNPTKRVKTLFGKLHSIRSSKSRGSQVPKKSELLLRKFAQQLNMIFKSLPKSLEWHSFYRHDLPLLLDISKEVRNASMQNGLNRSQTLALETLKEASSVEFQKVIANGRKAPKSNAKPEIKDSACVDLKDLSGREINSIAEKAVKRKC